MPRRYRGQDLTWWFGALGLFDMTAEQRGPIRVNPSITGAYGGYTIDFRRFAADGITLLGRVLAARDGVLEIAPGLAESLANGDVYYAGFLDMLDAHVERHGLDLPDDPAARIVLADPPCVTEPIRRLDLGTVGDPCGDLGHRLRRRFQLDRPSGQGWQRRTGPSGRRVRGAGALLPRPAVSGRNCIPPSCPASATMPPCSPITSPPAAEVPAPPENTPRCEPVHTGFPETMVCSGPDDRGGDRDPGEFRHDLRRL